VQAAFCGGDAAGWGRNGGADKIFGRRIGQQGIRFLREV
jgi:hypothetical protein